MRSHVSHVIGAALLCLSGLGTALAQESPSSSRYQALLDEGCALLQADRHAEAEAALQNAITLESHADTARYWLGMCYLKQDRLTDAKRQFQRLTGAGSTYAKGFDGLGLVLLREKHRGFDALAAFQQAAMLDSTDAEVFYHTGLAYMTLMTRGPLSEHPYVDKALRAFEQAIVIDPNHPDAAYQVGRLYEGASNDVYSPMRSDAFYGMGRTYNQAVDAQDKATQSYAYQIRVNPYHNEAIRALGILQSRMGHHDVAQKLLRALNARYDPLDPHLLMDLALVQWRALNWKDCRATFGILIPLLPEKERRLFEDLTLVTSNAEAKQIKKQPAGARDAFWRDFWADRDVVPLTDENERLIEHYARVAYALRNFGKGGFPWDRRGDMLVRYGLPDRISQSHNFSTYVGGMRSWQENWLYYYLKDTAGTPLAWTFESVFFSRRFGYPHGVRDDGIRKVNPPELHIPRELGLPLIFVYDPVIYRDENGEPFVEIAYGVLPKALTRVDSVREGRSLDMGAVLYDAAWNRVLVDSARVSVDLSTYTVASDQVVTTQAFPAPPGAYRLVMQLQDRQGWGFGVERDSLMVPSFDQAGLKMSGVRLASQLSPLAQQPMWPRYANRRIIPNPSHIYRQGEPVHFYVEIYDIARDEADAGRYQVAIEVRKEQEVQQSKHPVWRLLSHVEQWMDREEQQVVTMTFEQPGRSDTEAWTSAIDTEDLAAGVYTLRVAITDLSTRSTVSQGQIFRVID